MRHPAITCRARFTLKSEKSIQHNIAAHIAQQSCRERVKIALPISRHDLTLWQTDSR